jgi:hypothetical protein
MSSSHIGMKHIFNDEVRYLCLVTKVRSSLDEQRRSIELPKAVLGALVLGVRDELTSVSHLERRSVRGRCSIDSASQKYHIVRKEAAVGTGPQCKAGHS